MSVDITIVVPTVTGREHHLKRCLAAYKANTSATCEVLTYLDLPGVAFGWQRGAEDASGRYIHLSCDDIEPMPGWDKAAIRTVEAGFQPAPRLFDADGSPWHPIPELDPHILADGAPIFMSSLPFLDRDWWQYVTPLPPGMHYYADNYVSLRLARAAVVTAVCHGYDFIHHQAPEHRGAGWTEDYRMAVDQQYAQTVLAIIERGEAGLRARAS